jgi:hypothetical protein
MNLYSHKPNRKNKAFSLNNLLRKSFLVVLVFCTSLLFGQTSSNILLIKTVDRSGLSGGQISFHWVATNNTSKSGNFYILENLPSSYLIQSIKFVNQSIFPLLTNPSLPLSGPASITIGPFSIAANSSVTFQVTGSIQNILAPGQIPSSVGESFFLLTDSQLTAKNSRNQSSGSSSQSQENSNTTGLIQSLVAEPNIAKNNQPIDFSLNLSAPAKVDLVLFTVAGEEVYDTQIHAGQGINTIIWNTQNSTGNVVASGLYIYLLKAQCEGTTQTRTGKVLIIH